jgi:hypothetical protein
MENDELKKKLQQENLLFDYGRVVTLGDLDTIQDSFYIQLLNCGWYEIHKRIKFVVAIATIDAMIRWVEKGKPSCED